MQTRFERSDIWLLLIAALSAVVFFSSLGRLWPLAATDLERAPAELIAEAREYLVSKGIGVEQHVAASRLYVDERLLDYLLRELGTEATQDLIRSGRSIYVYDVFFKKRDEPDYAWATIHPEKGVVGWGRTFQEDAPGAVVELESARLSARDAIGAAAGVRLGDVEETGQISRQRPARTDHVFIYESWLSRDPELRERVTATVSGDMLSSIQRELVLPDGARRDARKREASVVALQVSGILLLAIAGFAALVVFLTRLQRGEVRLRRAAGWVAIIATFFLITQALRSTELLLTWDPLWPRWIATFQSLAYSAAQGAWIAFALFVVIAAGDALDRESGAFRGRSFWAAGTGKLLDPQVGLASLRGFLIGLVCGGALVVTIRMLELTAGAKLAIQPQGFFFFAINSDIPALSTLLYFLMVALVEELGYRFFAGTWLLSRTRSRAIAILIPAIVYGSTHTGLGFIPPYEPFWGRAVAFTIIGCIWGWAFFRYDALTVVLSHFAADLFIFNWPRLGSGDPILMAKAIGTIAVPLVPGILYLMHRSKRLPA